MPLHYPSLKNLVCTLALTISIASPTAAEVPESSSQPAPVVYLHTEFMPYEITVEKGYENSLMRELARQSFLAAIREEFGLPTRDGTLFESIPAGAEVVHLALLERCDRRQERPWHLKLFHLHPELAEADTSTLWEKPAIWEKTIDWKGWVRIYEKQTPVLTKVARDEFLDALAELGVPRRERTEAVAPPVPQEVELWLRNVDFISQFRAIRQAHEVLDRCGPAAQWMEVLVRGYANLSLLSEHHWNASCYVFAARSFVYAHRLFQLTNGSIRARFHRAYAWALPGMHLHALADVREARVGQLAPGSYEGEPEWVELIDLFCRFQTEGLERFGQTNQAWRAWATRFNLQLAAFSQSPQRVYESFRQVREDCPTAYGSYHLIARRNMGRGAARGGVVLAPAMFSYFANERLLLYEELPQEVAGELVRSAELPQLDGSEWIDVSELFSPVPSRVASRLRAVASEETSGSLSWSVLAHLMEEESLVEAVNFLDVAANFGNFPLDDAVDYLMDLNGSHRYAAAIESFRFDRASQPEDYAHAIKSMRITDPRRGMLKLCQRAVGVINDQGVDVGLEPLKKTRRNYTLPGTLHYAFYRGNDWVKQNPALSSQLAKEVAVVSPHAEIGVRMQLEIAKDPSLKQLRDWERNLQTDWIAFRLLARHYRARDMTGEAMRCYVRSLVARRTFSTTKELAEFHRSLGDAEKWEQTWLGYIDLTENSYDQARARWQLASGFSMVGRWAAALPHAKSAAETHYSWALRGASSVCEALAHWDQSEHFIRELSEKYSSSSGWSWYFWCRRTGRGSLSQAEELADTYFAETDLSRTRGGQVMLGAYHVLKGDHDSAVEAYENALEFYTSHTCTFMLAQLAAQHGLTDRRLELIQSLEQYAKERDDIDADVVTAGNQIIRLLRDGNASQIRLAEIEDSLARVRHSETRGAFLYFVGKELELLDHIEQAETFYRRAMVIPGGDIFYATLAGHELCRSQGTSRRDNEALSRSDLWPTPKQASTRKPAQTPSETASD